jgi:hypothetical protein
MFVKFFYTENVGALHVWQRKYQTVTFIFPEERKPNNIQKLYIYIKALAKKSF